MVKKSQKSVYVVIECPLSLSLKSFYRVPLEKCDFKIFTYLRRLSTRAGWVVKKVQKSVYVVVEGPLTRFQVLDLNPSLLLTFRQGDLQSIMIKFTLQG